MVTTISMVSLTLSILVVFNAELCHFYLACIGREELFKWGFTQHFVTDLISLLIDNVINIYI